MTTSEGILKWMDENKDWFKPMGICKKLYIDKGNFSRYLKTEIPEKHLVPIMNIIMPLGFTLDELIEENNKSDVKAKILADRNAKPKKLMEQRIIAPDFKSIPKGTLPKIERLQGESSLDYRIRCAEIESKVKS